MAADTPGTAKTFDYVQFVKDGLQNERERRNSIRQRGVAIITTSGTLVTLFTVFTGTGRLTDLRSASLPVILALVSFVLAAALGIVTNITLPELGRDEKERTWDERKEDLSRGDAAKLSSMEVMVPEIIDNILHLRRANRLRIQILALALACEVLAIVLLGVALSIVLTR